MLHVIENTIEYTQICADYVCITKHTSDLSKCCCQYICITKCYVIEITEMCIPRGGLNPVSNQSIRVCNSTNYCACQCKWFEESGLRKLNSSQRLNIIVDFTEQIFDSDKVLIALCRSSSGHLKSTIQSLTYSYHSTMSLCEHMNSVCVRTKYIKHRLYNICHVIRAYTKKLLLSYSQPKDSFRPLPTCVRGYVQLQ